MKRLLLLILVVALALPVFARGAAEQSSDVKTTNKGTLVVAMQADARSLDPHATNDQPSARVMKQIYETLMHQSEELDISLGLATGYEVVSPTEYVFTLKQGVKFHNGEELTAHDVKYTFERMRQVGSLSML
ncbi:MAG TPA: ABC transporter substrate-binding protein [Sphaerochaetaceae bacterium]|nr:ABC transporter substrate-binding protein [Sphaerochaetaceae bacterium]